MSSPREVGRRQRAGVGARVAAVVDVRRVGAALALNRDVAGDQVDRPGVGRGVRRDVDRVVAAAGLEERVGAGIRAEHVELRAVVAEADLEVLDGAVRDPDRHAEPGDRRRRQEAGLAGARCVVAGVVDVQPVAGARRVAVDRHGAVDRVEDAALVEQPGGSRSSSPARRCCRPRRRRRRRRR